MRKTKYNPWTRQYVRINKQQDIVDFLTKNPGYYSETQLFKECFGFDRNNMRPMESNKKYADLLRRAWSNGLVDRRLKAGTTARYEWFLVTTTDPAGKNFSEPLQNQNIVPNFTSTNNLKQEKMLKIETSNTAVNVNTIMSTVTLTIDQLAPGFPTLIARGEVVGWDGAEGEVCDWYMTMPSKPAMTTQEIDMALKVMLPEEEYKSLINSIESEMLNEASKAVSKVLNPTPECIDTKTSEAQIIREFLSGIDLAEIIRRTLVDIDVASNAEVNIQQQVGYRSTSFDIEINIDEYEIAREVTNELVSTFDSLLEELEEESAQ